MRFYSIRSVLLFLVSFSVGAVYAAPSAVIRLSNAHMNLHNAASILRGAKLYKSNCMTCHSLQYFTHNPIAKKADIKLSDMPLNDKQVWPGTPPPDLSLVVRQRGANWVYTYMHAFYDDPKATLGVNNLLVPGTSMTNVFLPMQGKQVLVSNPHPGSIWHHTLPPYFALLHVQRQGTMTPLQFDQMTHDLTNFLGYAAMPHAAQRESLGKWVLLFLLIFFVLAYCLKREYWKDLH
jgi:ubiquinol-cytochrome c reductase cytochrome c1 subunit